MKKAINVLSYPPDTGLEKIFEVAQDAGFDGVELLLAGEGEGPLATDGDAEDVERIRSLAEEYDREICGLMTGLHWGVPFTSDDAETRERAVRIGSRQLELASAFDVETALMVPGYVEAEIFEDSPVVEYEDAWNRAVEAFVRLSEDAEEHGVNIGVENVWNKFLLSPLEMRAFIDEVRSRAGNDRVGAYVDVGNVLKHGFPCQWIRILGRERIYGVHVKDYVTGVGSLDGFVDLLEGDVDWKRVTAALSEVGYDSWCTAEMLPPYDQAPYLRVYNTSGAMDHIFEMTQ